MEFLRQYYRSECQWKADDLIEYGDRARCACGLIAPMTPLVNICKKCGQDLFEEVGSDPDASYEQDL